MVDIYPLIRLATPSDAAGIARVRVETWRAAYRGLIAQDYLDQLNIQVDAARHEKNLAENDPARHVLVAEAPGSAIAGFCAGGPNLDKDAAEYSSALYAIYVLPEYQGRGYGQALFQAMKKWLAEQGHRRMILYVLRDNIPARRFYEAIGGLVVIEKWIEIGGQSLPEVGYGYDLVK